MEIPLPIHSAAPLVASGRGNRDRAILQFGKRLETSQVANQLEVPPISKVVQVRNPVERINLRHICIVVRSKLHGKLLGPRLHTGL
jgi:hypothetical protein